MAFSASGRSDPNSPNRTATGDIGDNVAALRADIGALSDSVKRLAKEQLGATAEEVQDKAIEKLGEPPSDATRPRQPLSPPG